MTLVCSSRKPTEDLILRVGRIWVMPTGAIFSPGDFQCPSAYERVQEVSKSGNLFNILKSSISQTNLILGYLSHKIPFSWCEAGAPSSILREILLNVKQVSFLATCREKCLLDRTCLCFSITPDSPSPLSSAVGKKKKKPSRNLITIEMAMKMPFTVSNEQDGNILYQTGTHRQK